MTRATTGMRGDRRILPITAHDSVASGLTEDGFSSVGPVLSVDDIEHGKSVLADLVHDSTHAVQKRVLSEPPRSQARSTTAPRKINDVARISDFFSGLLARPQVIALATAILGPDVKLHTSIAWLKPARIGSAKDAHQDLATWTHLVDARLFTLWLTFDDATVDNGCMHYVRGSHREGLYPHEQHASYSINGPTWDHQRVNACSVPAGYGTVHDGTTVHWTPANRSDRPRRAVSFSFVDARTRIAVGHEQLIGSFPVVAGSSHEGCV